MGGGREKEREKRISSLEKLFFFLESVAFLQNWFFPRLQHQSHTLFHIHLPPSRKSFFSFSFLLVSAARYSKWKMPPKKETNFGQKRNQVWPKKWTKNYSYVCTLFLPDPKGTSLASPWQRCFWCLLPLSYFVKAGVRKGGGKKSEWVSGRRKSNWEEEEREMTEWARRG